MKKKQIEKLVILDYSDATVHTYNIDTSKAEVDDDYVESLGFKMSECYWMLGKVCFIKHQGVLV